jgi:uncharacterized membrane protein
MTLDKLFLSLHVFGAFLWIGGLFATLAFIETTVAEPDAAAKARLVKATRAAAIVPDVGATIAIVFGAHWLMKFKLYEAHYMHPKLALVVVVLAIHVYLRTKVGKLKRNEAVTAPPVALKVIISLTALGIILFVVSKWPT